MGQRGARRDAARRLIAALSSSFDAVAVVLFAAPCAACGVLLDHPLEGPVCACCWQSVLPLTPPLCDRCGDPLPTWRVLSTSTARCPRCRRGPRFVDRARAIGAYDGALRAIIHALKYDGRRSLATRLGRMMSERGGDMLTGVACAVPVPLHWSRQRHRGFNQADDLARALGVPVVRGLARVRRTAAQTELPAARRHRNVRDAFAPTAAARDLRSAAVVLVDDVSTTGATLEACARQLKEAGVAEVRALTAARVVSAPR